MSRVLAALVAAFWPAALAADATIVGGGVDLFARPSLSPGAPPGTRSQLVLDAGWPVGGVGLQAAGLELWGVWERWSASAGASLLTSPIGERLTGALAVQVHGHGWRVGGAALPRNWQFDGYAGQWDLVLRGGAGFTSRQGIDVVLRLERTPGVAPAVAAAVRFPVAHARLEAQIERVPGRPTDIRLGATSGGDAFAWRAGFDLETRAARLGCTWSWQRLALVWGACTHPHLGWSHAWTCVHAL